MRAVQLALARLGYPLRGSASFADKTLSAVKDFQQAHGLEADGEIGKETAQGDRPRTRGAEFHNRSFCPTISGLVGDRILRVGDAGPIVQAVQLGLARLGYPLKGTGNYGPATEQAVRDFQARHALEVDGEMGPEVATAIDRALERAQAAPLRPAAGRSGPRSASGRQPDSGSRSRRNPPPPACWRICSATLFSAWAIRDQRNALQLALAKLGYPLRGTGYFGGATEAAVMDFQQQRGLEVDGEVGAETARAIDQAVAGAPRPSSPEGRSHLEPPPGTDTRPLWVIEGLKWLNLREGRGAAENSDILNGQGTRVARSRGIQA